MKYDGLRSGQDDPGCARKVYLSTTQGLIASDHYVYCILCIGQ